jgi:hypothetical protein
MVPDTDKDMTTDMDMEMDMVLETNIDKVIFMATDTDISMVMNILNMQKNVSKVAYVSL